MSRAWAQRLRGMAVAVALAAAVFGLCGLTVPDAGNRLRDDAFYEFAWAANLAGGRGPTVSDGATTSGVQWLWCLLLTPLVWLFGAGALPVAAPGLGLALHVATAVAWWRGLRDRWTGGIVGLCWLGHPLLVRECQNGQETALACFAATLLWLARRGSERRFLGLALVAVASRSDLLAFVAVLSCWRHRGALWRALPAPLLALLLHVGVARLLGGGWLPDSALPMAWLFHEHGERIAAVAGDSGWSRTWWFLRPVLLGGPFALASSLGIGFAVFACLRPFWPAGLRALPALAVGIGSGLGVRDLATPGWTALLLALFPAARRRRPRCELLAALLGLGAIVLLHWAMRWYPRDYYVAPLVVAAMAAVARYGRLRLLLITFALVQVFDARRVSPEPLAGQREMELAGRHLAAVLPAGERVGCFNSGLVTFYADVLAAAAQRHGIVNLDGVVDARTFAAGKARSLAAWLDAHEVRFVLDNALQFARDEREPHACGDLFGADFEAARDLVEVARFDVPGLGNERPDGDSLRLYWRRGRGAAPVLSAKGVRLLGGDMAGGTVVAWTAAAGATLRIEHADGRREPLAHADVDTTVVVWIARERHGTGRLFVGDSATPALHLPAL